MGGLEERARIERTYWTWFSNFEDRSGGQSVAIRPYAIAESDRFLRKNALILRCRAHHLSPPSLHLLPLDQP